MHASFSHSQSVTPHFMFIWYAWVFFLSSISIFIDKVKHIQIERDDQTPDLSNRVFITNDERIESRSSLQSPGCSGWEISWGKKKKKTTLTIRNTWYKSDTNKKTLQCCLYRVSFQHKDTLSALQKKPLAITKEKLSVMELRVANNKGDANIA